MHNDVVSVQRVPSVWKSPAKMRGFLFYLLRPEPGPVGVNVDPLGEALGRGTPQRVIRWVSGTVLVALGVRVALERT